MDKLNIFVPLAKVDLEKRLVYGVLAEEALDKSGEIFDYETSKPLFQAWSGDFEKRTTALGVAVSKGNVRGMHEGVAAGRFTEMHFNDVEKRIDVVAKVIDDNEWEKCKEGVYTGFSVGGDYARKWKDPVVAKATRYTAKPAEGSLVDNPCMYGATFTAIKAGGATELRKFAGEVAPTPAPSIADMRKSVEAFIEKHGLKKSLYDVCSLADVVMSLQCVISWCESDAFFEGEPAPGLAELKAALQGLGAALLAMTAEEVAELTGSTPGLEMAMNADDLKKFSDAATDAVTKALTPVTEKVTKLESATTPEAMIKTVQDGVVKTVTESLTKSFTETVTKAVEPLAKAADVKAIDERLAKNEADTKKLLEAPAPVGSPLNKSLGTSPDGTNGSEVIKGIVDGMIAKAIEGGASKEQTDKMRIEAATHVARQLR